jgi:hypothetical protein
MTDNIFVENLLRKIYQCTEQLTNTPVTTTDVAELLQLHNTYLEPHEVNTIMENIGFIGRSIQNQADKLWLVVQAEKS